jgi:VanZ family protein
VHGIRRLIAPAIVLYAAASLWPFEFEPPALVENGATPGAQGGWVFEVPGLLRTAAPPAWVGDAMRSHELELALAFRTATRPTEEFAPILTLSRNRYHRNLAVGQEGRDLVLRLRTPDSEPKGRSFRVADVFPAARWAEVVVSVGAGRVRVTVDGTPGVDRALPERPLSTWDPSYRLTLGNEAAGNRPWLGALRHATVRSGDVRVELTAAGDLERPERYWAFRTSPQLVPFRDASPEDIVLNALVYLPLGLLLGARRRASGGRARPRPWVVILLVSATLELLQFFVSVRSPSTGDLLLNLLGGVVGAWAGGVLMLEWMARRVRHGGSR